jgi:hypothetical protein
MAGKASYKMFSAQFNNVNMNQKENTKSYEVCLYAACFKDKRKILASGKGHLRMKSRDMNAHAWVENTGVVAGDQGPEPRLRLHCSH